MIDDRAAITTNVDPVSSAASVTVPPERFGRWVAGFADRHGRVETELDSGALVGRAPDGSHFRALLPFDEAYVGGPGAEAFVAAAAAPADWGVLLVRKGGFAVARLTGPRLTEHKVGRRHVQGRTKAGGQSQQRFARRRDLQARRAYEAAAEHAVRILGGTAHGALPVVTGGDRPAVEAVLADPRLRGVRVVAPWLPVPDPGRAVLEGAIGQARSIRVAVVNA